jgi:hypothetical protein
MPLTQSGLRLGPQVRGDVFCQNEPSKYLCFQQNDLCFCVWPGCDRLARSIRHFLEMLDELNRLNQRW